MILWVEVEMKLCVIMFCLSCVACSSERRVTHHGTAKKDVRSAGPEGATSTRGASGADSVKEVTSSDAPPIQGLEARELAIYAITLQLDASIGRTPGESKQLDHFAAEGAFLTTWTEGGALRRAVVESKGESLDAKVTFYWHDGAPLLARSYTYTDPAKFAAPGDEGYDELAAARSVQARLIFFEHGEPSRIYIVNHDTVTEPAVYDSGGSLVEVPPVTVSPGAFGEDESLLVEWMEQVRAGTLGE